MQVKDIKSKTAVNSYTLYWLHRSSSEHIYWIKKTVNIIKLKNFNYVAQHTFTARASYMPAQNAVTLTWGE